MGYFTVTCSITCYYFATQEFVKAREVVERAKRLEEKRQLQSSRPANPSKASKSPKNADGGKKSPIGSKESPKYKKDSLGIAVNKDKLNTTGKELKSPTTSPLGSTLGEKRSPVINTILSSPRHLPETNMKSPTNKGDVSIHTNTTV